MIACHECREKFGGSVPEWWRCAACEGSRKVSAQFFHELAAPLYVQTEMGGGWAIFVERHSYDNHLWWTVVMDDGGGVVTLENPKIRMDKAWTLGRIADPTFKAERKPFRAKDDRLTR